MTSNWRKILQNCSSRFATLICVTFILQLHASSSIGASVRSVFPHDFVKFTCAKSLPSSRVLQDRDLCTWDFFTGDPQAPNETVTQVSKECTRTSNASVVKGTVAIYEGYLEVPEKAHTILCKGDEETVNLPQALSVQNVRLAEPLSSLDSSTPKIILQRFSDDYATRLGAHEVTNQKVSLDGTEVDRIKLMCIHDTEVFWKNYTDSGQRLLRDLEDRDMHWLHSHPTDRNLAKKWKAYLDFLRNIELESINGTKTRLRNDRTVYSVPLLIRNVTNSTSREYECRTVGSDQYSSVAIEVENPRIIGPDDILLVQQIIAILDALAQGKGDGSEPWYTLASLLSIILLLFGYYCKKKLNNPPESQNTPPSNPPAAAAVQQEEVELRTKLRSSQPEPEPTPQRISISPIREVAEESHGSPAVIDTTPLTEVSVRKDP